MYLCMLIFILATIVIIPMEGKRLENCYGEEYRAYKQRVRRWF
jgi:protein-S-isoprenylcysteine O-methyltransferase Ste14